MTTTESRIEVGKGGTGFVGPAAVGVFRAITIKHAIRFYAKTGMKVNRAYTPSAMLRAAGEITGKTFKRGAYTEAADALDAWLLANPVPVVNRDE